jgi:hypothetical protein
VISKLYRPDKKIYREQKNFFPDTTAPLNIFIGKPLPNVGLKKSI